MTGWKDRTEQIIIGLATNWVAPLLIGVGFFAWNWISSGAVVRAMGGMTKAEVAEYLKQNMPPANAPPSDWNFELVPGKTELSSENSDGSFAASAAPSDCEGSILIGGYCGILDEGSHRATGNLQRGGLGSDLWFYCTWNGVNKPDAFRGELQTVCLKLAKK
jgi:hypothetical protein